MTGLGVASAGVEGAPKTHIEGGLVKRIVAHMHYSGIHMLLEMDPMSRKEFREKKSC